MKALAITAALAATLALGACGAGVHVGPVSTGVEVGGYPPPPPPPPPNYLR